MQIPVGTLDEANFPDVLAAARTGAPWAAEVLFRDVQPRMLRFLRSTERCGAWKSASPATVENFSKML